MALKKDFTDLKARLKRELEQKSVMDFTAVSSELVYVSTKLSLKDVFEVFETNRINTLLLFNEEQAVCDGILVQVDFLNLIVKLGEDEELCKNEQLLNSLFEKTTIEAFMKDYKTFWDIQKQELFTIDIKEKLSLCLRIFREKKIGHVITVVEQGKDKSSRKEYFSIFTKKDFLLNILRNFHATKEDLSFLQTPIIDAFSESIIMKDKLITITDSSPLLEAFKKINKNKISFLPVVNSENKYSGFLNRLHISWFLEKKLFSFLSKSIKEFLDFLNANNLKKEIVNQNIFFTMNTCIRDVLEQLLYTSGQLLWVENGELKGMLSLHDLLSNFF